MGRIIGTLRALPKLINENKSVIFRRIMIYGIILLMMAPVIFINRTQIYSSLLSRHDDYGHSYDESGLPITDYGYQAGIYVGPHTTPRQTANEARRYYNQMLSGNTTAEIYFNNTIQWLIGHKSEISVPTENGTEEIIHWYFDFTIWDLPSGWYQSMTDAKALHALAIAYDLFGNETYLEIADKIAKSFEIPVRLGGNLYVLEDGTSWYPEYIVPNELAPGYTPDFILNGFLIALNHLYMANQIFNSTRIQKVFDQGIVSAAANLYKYDMDVNWTLYHLAYPEKVAPKNYHQIHIDLTGYLYDYTNVTIFKTFSDRWSSYTQYPSFTVGELTSPEFFYFGLVVATLILVPLTAIDITQIILRKYLKKRSRNISNLE